MISAAINQALNELDAEILIRDVGELSRIARRTDFDSFEAEAAWVAQKASDFGLESETWRLPADGETPFHSYTSPIGFRTRRATLDIVEPAGLRGRLADRDTVPQTAIVGTGHTGPDGITAELVLIADPAQFQTTNVAGRIVFCPSHHVMGIRGLCVKHRALALLSSFNRSSDGSNREAVKWNNTWDSASDGWLPTRQAAVENLPGLAITPAQGEKIAERLRAGERILAKIVVEGEYFAGTMPVATAFTPGSVPDELWVIAHIFEQGAWDNASGVICSLHAGRLLRGRAGRDGRLPKRGLRHVHTQECYGVLGLHALHPERLAPVKASLCIDGVGIREMPVHIKPALGASGDFTQRILREALRIASERLATPRGESEHFEINCTLLADPRTGNVPTSMIGTGDTTPEIWHTNRDIPEVLDGPQLLLAAAATAAWSLFLATAGTAEIRWALQQYPRWIAEDRDAGRIRDGEIYLDQLRRELRALAVYADSESDADALRSASEDLLGEAAAKLASAPRFTPAGSAAELATANSIFPEALWTGPALDAFFTAEQQLVLGPPKWDHNQLILATWCDGTRPLTEALRRTACETGEADRLTLAWGLAWVDALSASRLMLKR